MLYCRGTVSKFWEYTVVGAIAGLILGWVLSLVSGDTFVVLLVGTMGTVVGIVLGIVHRYVMSDDARSGRRVLSPRVRKFWQVLSIVLFVLLFSSFLIGLSMFWWPGVPSSPQPSEGRVYPLNNHCHYTYMNRQEYLLNESMKWIFFVLFWPFAAIIHFIDPFDEKRRWRPMIPPRPWWQ